MKKMFENQKLKLFLFCLFVSFINKKKKKMYELPMAAGVYAGS